MSRTKGTELTAGKYVKWADISLHPNSKACKPWAMHVTDTHEKFGVEGDWLDKKRIDGKVHFDVSGLIPGDILKISGASHNNKKNAYYRIESVSGEFVVTRMSEADVIESLEAGDDEIDALRTEVQHLVAEIDEEETLEAIKEMV